MSGAAARSGAAFGAFAQTPAFLIDRKSVV